MQEEGNYWRCARLCPGSWPKGRTAQPRTEELLASFCFIKLAFLLKLQRGDAPRSIVLVAEFHLLSIISFVIDLFNLFLFLPVPGSYFTVDLSYTVNHVLLSIV